MYRLEYTRLIFIIYFFFLQSKRWLSHHFSECLTQSLKILIWIVIPLYCRWYRPWSYCWRWSTTLISWTTAVGPSPTWWRRYPAPLQVGLSFLFAFVSFLSMLHLICVQRLWDISVCLPLSLAVSIPLLLLLLSLILLFNRDCEISLSVSLSPSLSLSPLLSFTLSHPIAEIVRSGERPALAVR